MGTKINAQENSESENVRSVKAMCTIVIERSFSLLQMFDLTYPLTKNYYVQKRALKVLHGHTNSVITKRRKELQNQPTKKMQNDEFVPKTKKAFLDLMLDATVDGRPLTQKEIQEEVDTFMFEVQGHVIVTFKIIQILGSRHNRFSNEFCYILSCKSS
jgi:cytochrome P450 family 4